MRKPDFDNILAVLNNSKPSRPTLFEFFLNDRLITKLAGRVSGRIGVGECSEAVIAAFKNAGYDYTTVLGADMSFCKHEQDKATISLNAKQLIKDRKTFNDYPWPDCDKCDFSRLEKASKVLPDGMKLIIYSPDGVMENVIRLVGYDNLCLMLTDAPDLAEDIFKAVGQRLVRYYQICGSFKTVGAMISNDDWGFKTQPLLSPQHMRTYVIPWHKKIVETIHASGKRAILHSCGQLQSLMDDIIDGIGYDAKHSYEDAILPVEEAYQRWGRRIAILGGIDVDFMCRSEPEEIKSRCKKMLELSRERGGYALGTGNSVPEYVPDANYMAMISTISEVNC